MVRVIFDFKSQKDLDAVVNAAKKLGIAVQPEVQEDAPPGLGQTAASALVGGLQKTKQQQQQQQKKPQTPQEKATADMADELDQAIEKNPTLKRNMQQAMQRMGIKFESIDRLSRMIFQDYLKESDFQTAKGLTKMFSPNGTLFENTVDELTMQMMEFFVTLKAQGVKDIPLSKLVKSISASDMDIDPNQDMEFFVDLLASLPVVKNVDPSTNKVYLEMPGSPDDSEEDPEEVKQTEKDNIEDVATSKAKTNIKDKTKGNKEAAGNLFASVEYDEPAIAEDWERQPPFYNYDQAELPDRLDRTIRVSKTVTDELVKIQWNGMDRNVFNRVVGNVYDGSESSGVDYELVKTMAADMFKRQNGKPIRTLGEGQSILELLQKLEFPVSNLRFDHAKQAWLVEGITK